MASGTNETGCVRWRELALQHLSCCREIIDAATSHVDLWWSLKALLCEWGTTESRKTEMESIYRYAWWCVAGSGNKRLASEVKTYFYEDLSVYWTLEPQVVRYIEPWQFERLESAFRYRLSDDKFAAFRSRYYDERERMKGMGT